MEAQLGGGAEVNDVLFRVGEFVCVGVEADEALVGVDGTKAYLVSPNA